MNPDDFIQQIDFSALESAIVQAEMTTSGQIRVAIVRHAVDDAVGEATEIFEEEDMHRTRERNGVLLLVAPRSQSFAVIGDLGVHQKCGDAFWHELTRTMSVYFKSGDFTPGLLHGIEQAGKLLAAHFPHQPDDRDELSNQVIVV